MSNSTPDVRPARKDDRTRVGQLWMDLLTEQTDMDERFQVSEDALARWHNDYPFWLSDERRRLFVAEEEGVVVGFITAHRSSPAPIYREASEVYIDELYVEPGARRKGYASQLLAAVRAWADDLEAHRLRLGMLAVNGAGRTFWEQHGATPFVSTMTVELRAVPENQTSDEGARKIGF